MLTTYLIILVSILIVTFAIIAGVLIILIHNHILNTSKRNYVLIQKEEEDIDLDAFATEKRIKKIKEKKIRVTEEKKKHSEQLPKKNAIKKDIESNLKNRLQEELLKSNSIKNEPLFSNSQTQQRKMEQATAFNNQFKSQQEIKEDEFFKKIANANRVNPFANQSQSQNQTQRQNIFSNTIDLTKKKKKQSKKELENDLQAKLLKAKIELNKARNNSSF